MTVDHRDLRELAAGGALDDLDPEERRALDSHIARCSSCAALAAELDDLLAELALAAPVVSPPVRLQRTVFAAIRRLDAAGVGGGQADAAPVLLALPRDERPAGRIARPRAARLPAVAGLAAAAVLGAVAVGLGWRVTTLADDLAATRTQLAAERALVAVAADPAHRTAALHAPTGPSATVVYVPGGDAWFVSHDLPATPPGRVYQLWHADGNGVHPLGTFTHDGQGPVVARFGVDLAGSAAAMVTLEPVGGARGEPGPEVVFGEL